MTRLDRGGDVHLRTSVRRPATVTGRPVVLVHGWKQSHRLWDATAVRLVERGHPVVSYDLRGMGESAKPAEDYGFDDHASDLTAVLEAYEVADATVVGWSMGCTVALQHCASHPPRVGRLVLLNGPLRLTRTAEFPHAMTTEQFESYLDAMLDRWPASEREFQAESVLDATDTALVDLLYSVALQTPLDVALAVVRRQAEIDHTDTVNALRIPVLAAYSRHDPYYPASLADDIASRARDGRKHIFDASAHCTPLEEPGELADVVSTFDHDSPQPPDPTRSS